LGQYIFLGDIDWSEVKDESWDGLKSGMIAGGFAVLSGSASANKLFGLDPKTLATHCGGWLKQASTQALKHGAKEATLGTLEEMTHICVELATDPKLQAKWKDDPEGAFTDFRNRLLLAGTTSFASGSAGGALTKPSKSAPLGEFMISRKIREQGAKALNTNSTVFKSLKSALVEELPPQIASSLTEVVLQGYLNGEQIDEEWIQNKLLSIGLKSAVSGFSGDVKGKAKKVAEVLKGM
jgi:hypothetical protein